jgi:predicted transcriptional regulator
LFSLLFKQRIAVSTYKDYVVFRRKPTIRVVCYIPFTGICTFEKHAFYASKFTSTIDIEYRKNLERLTNLENNRKRRDRLYIIAEILEIAKGGSLKTQIMYRANLSFAQLNEYLSFLIKMKLLEIKNENNKNTYRTTDKGEKYLEKYEDLANLLGNNERDT